MYTMLKESPFVESDPEKADYFYLPLYNYWQVEQLCSSDHSSQLAPSWWLSHWLPYSTTRLSPKPVKPVTLSRFARVSHVPVARLAPVGASPTRSVTRQWRGTFSRRVRGLTARAARTTSLRGLETLAGVCLATRVAGGLEPGGETLNGIRRVGGQAERDIKEGREVGCWSTRGNGSWRAGGGAGCSSGYVSVSDAALGR